MATLNGLPVYNIKIDASADSNEGVDFISLVDYPAILTNWVAMGDHKKPMRFEVNNEKQLLCGPILIADLPIYRFDKDLGEYYVVFGAEVIEQLVRKFQSSQKSINLNYQHQENSQIKQAVVQEIWITSKNDKSKDLGFDLPVNSAFVCAHIGDKEFWDKEVKTGNVRGFSIEGFLDMELRKLINHKMKKENFTAFKTADGGADVFIDGEVAVGNYVFSNWPEVKLVDGKKQVTQWPIWESTVVLEDGTILNLKDSKILSIEKKQGMSKTKLAAEAKTSDGKNLKTTADAMAVGSDLMIVDEAGAETPCPDGEYTLENGDMVTVAGGKITAINEMALTDDESKILEEAAMKIVEPELKKLRDKVAELETKLANTPGAAPKTSHTDTPLPATPTSLSAKKTLLSKLEILSKKNKELKKNEPAK